MTSLVSDKLFINANELLINYYLNKKKKELFF